MAMKQRQAKCSGQAQLFCCNHGTYAGNTTDVNKGILAGTLSHLVGSRGATITAGELCLVTTFGLGLFHRHDVRNKKAPVRVALIRNTISITFTASAWRRRDSSQG
ncbi:uncharacterized protein N7482_010761 [Penicillium canariense]|uniref:Uncharacterized protein n=1 Tax=Penicillium canariense TaxID=189055 RepID=A0A9W9LED1_9EURO|nr:uncharacterized protein N7482_010761 [Penicillium canariense]KAJ5151509.1 hypothetical protein N7482_010761 [Penicillium canariense]